MICSLLLKIVQHLALRNESENVWYKKQESVEGFCSNFIHYKPRFDSCSTLIGRTSSKSLFVLVRQGANHEKLGGIFRAMPGVQDNAIRRHIRSLYAPLASKLLHVLEETVRLSRLLCILETSQDRIVDDSIRLDARGVVIQRPETIQELLRFHCCVRSVTLARPGRHDKMKALDVGLGVAALFTAVLVDGRHFQQHIVRLANLAISGKRSDDRAIFDGVKTSRGVEFVSNAAHVLDCRLKHLHGILTRRTGPVMRKKWCEEEVVK